MPAPKRERLIQRHPTLWSAKCETPRMWCGPVAVAAIIGVDPVTVCDVIQQQRKNRRPVKRTYPHELHAAFAHFGYDMTLVANLGINPPTLATWERQRTDLESAFVPALFPPDVVQ